MISIDEHEDFHINKNKQDFPITNYENNRYIYFSKFGHLVYPFPIFFTGNSDVGAHGKMRIFFSQPHCRESLNLVKGKTYLIMGVSKDIYLTEQEQS